MVSFMCAILILILTLPAGATTTKAQKTFKLPETEVKAKPLTLTLPVSETTNTITPDLEVGTGWAHDPTSYLREMPSIYAIGSPRGKRLFLRDLPERDMQILLNGVPIGQRGFYHARGFEWAIIPLDFVERFEVTRGLSSPELGNAISGAINIVTKSGTEKPRTTLKASYGRFDDWKVSLSHSRTVGPLSIFLGSSYRDSGPYLRNNRLQDYSFFGSTRFKLKQGFLTLLGFDLKRKEGYVLDRRILEHSMSASSLYNYKSGSYYNLERQSLQSIYTSDWFDLFLSYNREMRNENPKKDVWNPRDVRDCKIDFRTYTAKARLHHRFSSHFLKIGGELTRNTWWDRWERLSPKGFFFVTRDDMTQDFISGFLEDEWNPSDRLTLNIGLRYDYFKNRISGFWERTDDLLSPRFSLIYRVSKSIKLYGRVSRLFKSPEAADIFRWYGNYMFFSPSGRMIAGWLGLSPSDWKTVLGKIKPSRGWDYEVGLKYEGENFAAGVGLFLEDVDDYIVIFPTYYPPTYNIDNLKLWGLELQARWKPSRYFEIAGSYTFEENDTDGDYLVDAMFNKDQLFDAPKHVLTVTLRSNPLKGLRLEWQTRVVGRRFGGPGSPISPNRSVMELPGYAVSSFRVDFTRKVAGINAIFSLSVENVFSRRVWERVDYYTAPVSIYGGIKLTF